MRIIGCDLHARQQTLAMLDTTTGEVVNLNLMHEGDQVREFYSKLPRPVLGPCRGDDYPNCGSVEARRSSRFYGRSPFRRHRCDRAGTLTTKTSAARRRSNCRSIVVPRWMVGHPELIVRVLVNAVIAEVDFGARGFSGMEHARSSASVVVGGAIERTMRDQSNT